MNLKNYAFVALAIVGLTACKKNNSNDPENVSTGEDTKISLSLSIASSGTKTYAPGDGANATKAELDMNTIDIFIYDNVSPFTLTHKHFEDKDDASADFKDFVINSVTTRRLKDNIVLDAKTGNKLIYVGVNLPASIVNQIKATQGLASLEGVFSTMQLFSEQAQDLFGSGMAMFSNVGTEATLEKEVDGIPSANLVSFELTRMLAKVTVDGTGTFNDRIADARLSGGSLIPVLGGSIYVNTLGYSLAQTNDSTYLKGSGDIDWKGNTNFFAAGQFNPFKSGNDLNINYAPENLAENDLAKLTYAVVQAQFKPEVFADEANYDYAEFTTFYTVTDPSNGSVEYYINQSKAIAAAIGGKELRKYTDAICYYHIYLNPENDHKVVRNEYYQVKISNIRGIGKSSANVAFESGINLYNPELLDPLFGHLNTLYVPQPAATNTDIEATVTIAPWTVVASEVEL